MGYNSRQSREKTSFLSLFAWSTKINWTLCQWNSSLLFFHPFSLPLSSQFSCPAVPSQMGTEFRNISNWLCPIAKGMRLGNWPLFFFCIAAIWPSSKCPFHYFASAANENIAQVFLQLSSHFKSSLDFLSQYRNAFCSPPPPPHTTHIKPHSVGMELQQYVRTGIAHLFWAAGKSPRVTIFSRFRQESLLPGGGL